MHLLCAHSQLAAKSKYEYLGNIITATWYKLQQSIMNVHDNIQYINVCNVSFIMETTHVPRNG
jgi:hypothetical protein